MTSSLATFVSLFIKQIDSMLLYVCNSLSNRSQMMSKCGKNISDTLGCASYATFSFLPHFDVICDLTEQTHGNMESVC